MRTAPHVRSNRGFTLIELLVAISVMALLAVLSWRGLDGMARSQAQTSQRADEVLNLQAGLGQWKVDLDSLTQTPQITSLAWDGRVLRLTRRVTTGSDGLVVVAWVPGCALPPTVPTPAPSLESELLQALPRK